MWLSQRETAFQCTKFFLALQALAAAAVVLGHDQALEHLVVRSEWWLPQREVLPKIGLYEPSQVPHVRRCNH